MDDLNIIARRACWEAIDYLDTCFHNVLASDSPGSRSKKFERLSADHKVRVTVEVVDG